MWRQVGPLQLDEHGAAPRGLLVRHLVLPGQLENRRGVRESLAGPGAQRWVAVSVMAQYFPAYRAVRDGAMNRRVTYDERCQATVRGHRIALTAGWLP